MKRIFRKSGCPENFIDKFLDNIHLVKENLGIVKEKPLLVVIPYLGVILVQIKLILLHIRTKLQQALKGVSNCCKLQIAFRCQTTLSSSFQSQDPTPKDLIQELYISFIVVSANSPIENM